MNDQAQDVDIKKLAKDGINQVDGKPAVELTVYSPFKVYFKGLAFSISGVNDTGPFDILPGHHNFMTLLNMCQLDIDAPKGQESLQISRGIMHVKANKIIVFLDV